MILKANVFFLCFQVKAKSGLRIASHLKSCPLCFLYVSKAIFQLWLIISRLKKNWKVFWLFTFMLFHNIWRLCMYFPLIDVSFHIICSQIPLFLKKCKSFCSPSPIHEFPWFRLFKCKCLHCSKISSLPLFFPHNFQECTFLSFQRRKVCSWFFNPWKNECQQALLMLTFLPL